MDKSLDKPVEQSEQRIPVSNSVLTEETYRAIAMMKRVRKANNVQLESPTEQQKMPSYLLPDLIILCQSGD